MLEKVEMLRKSRDTPSTDFMPMLTAEMDAGTRQGFVVPDSQLLADGMGSLLAGTDTTGATLSCGAWAIFSNEAIYERLHTELKEAWPDRSEQIALTDLENLPYLNASVKASRFFTSYT